MAGWLSMHLIWQLLDTPVKMRSDKRFHWLLLWTGNIVVCIRSGLQVQSRSCADLLVDLAHFLLLVVFLGPHNGCAISAPTGSL